MKKVKKTKATLDRIVAQLRTMLRRATKDVIVIGKLLIESRKHLEHGEWQDWLQGHFDLSYRTAVNYCEAAEYVARKSKSETISDFTALAPTVLYWLAAGHYTAEEEAAILAATRKCRVDQTRASAICDALTPPDSEQPDQPDGADEAVEAAEDPQSTAILDGPPPDVPPPAPNTTTDFTLRAFDQAVNALKQLMTKPAARFAYSVHASDLEGVESFLRAVADRAREAAARTESGNAYGGPPTEVTR
jgi:Protein of unknown function (DUF3102)